MTVSMRSMAVLSSRAHERRSREIRALPPQPPRGFSGLAHLYYLARPTKTAMLRTLHDCMSRPIWSWKIYHCMYVVSGKPVISIQSRFNTSRFDTNPSSEIAQKCCSPQVQFVSEQEKYFEWISSFFKPRTWNYLHLEWINLYRNDLYQNNFVSKRLLTSVSPMSTKWW